jgi:uncharacterized protein
VFSLLIDIDRLEEAGRATPLFSVGRFNLLSFRPSDHGDKSGDLRRYVNRVLRQAGLREPPARVMLLCYPRMLGTAFNPIAVYFAYDAEDEIIAVIYEVRNTFGEQHSYVAPVAAGEFSEAGLRQERDKLFYVSPFNTLEQRYLFRIRPPTKTLALRILQRDSSGPMLAATFSATQKHLTSGQVLISLAKVPLLTATVIGGIHWEALKLWLKGMTIKARPAPPKPISFGEARGAQGEGLWDAQHRPEATPAPAQS